MFTYNFPKENWKKYLKANFLSLIIIIIISLVSFPKWMNAGILSQQLFMWRIKLICAGYFFKGTGSGIWPQDENSVLGIDVIFVKFMSNLFCKSKTLWTPSASDTEGKSALSLLL